MSYLSSFMAMNAGSTDKEKNPKKQRCFHTEGENLVDWTCEKYGSLKRKREIEGHIFEVRKKQLKFLDA